MLLNEIFMYNMDYYYGNYSSENYLRHYGVLGMKWGVHRALKSWHNATDKASKVQAANSLQKHHNKITSKITTLDTKTQKLGKKKFKYETKTKPKITKYSTKAIKLENKAYKMGVGKMEKAKKLEGKARKLDKKASKLELKGAKMDSKIIKTNAKRMVYKQYLNKVDAVLLNEGKKYVSEVLKKN